MHITFNNKNQQIQEQTSLQTIIDELIGEKQKGIAVAINETVVPKAQWSTCWLQPDDKILVIKATQGG